jgi:hypothetical protein
MKVVGLSLPPITGLILGLTLLMLIGQCGRSTHSVEANLAQPLFLPVILRASTPITDLYQLTGSILLNQGICCAGGQTGETITLAAALTATSPITGITQMRLASRLAGGCYNELELANQPWIPYSTPLLIPLQINHVNWIGFYASVQFRDAAGYLSYPVCGEISIEGMPPTP